MNARIGVAEREDLAVRNAATPVSHRCDDAFLDGYEATSALAGYRSGAIGGGVVGKNGLDHVGTSR